MRNSKCNHQQGLTLIEVLIALLICAIALLAVISASNHSIETYSALQTKTLAMIAAENTMAAVQSGSITSPIQNQKTTLLGKDFFASVQFTQSNTPHLYSVTVSIKTAFSQTPIEILNSFTTL